MTTVIDKTTRVNLAILGTLVSMAAIGAFYFGGIKTTVESVDKSLRSMQVALDRNTTTLAKGATLDAVLQARIDGLERREVRIDKLETRIGDLERAK